MSWELTRTIFFSLGSLAVLVGLMLRVQVGRWLLAALLLVLMLVALLNGEWSSLDGDFGNADPLKASRYWLYSGALCLAIALLLVIFLRIETL